MKHTTALAIIMLMTPNVAMAQQATYNPNSGIYPTADYPTNTTAPNVERARIETMHAPQQRTQRTTSKPQPIPTTTPVLSNKRNYEMFSTYAAPNKERIAIETKAKKKYDKEKLKPRLEGNYRYGNDRTIYMGEAWIPLKQSIEDNDVIFTDIRIMGDNKDNEEFNAGLGYRKLVELPVVGEGVAGGMAWFDTRKTKRGSNLNQITLGGEWLGAEWDMRGNAYLPMEKEETFTTPNPNGASGGFVGTQLIVNTDQTVTEEALAGGDIEIGRRLDFMDGITDSTRVYAGAYHFTGDLAENVTGWRGRIASDITQDIQIGARYQNDDVRGDQTYLEATVRFPFKAKKSFQEEGVRSRLDEAPERDIDIVSNNKVIDDGVGKTVINNATGVAQNVIHVDNTAGGGGDGSVTTPFDTLAAAQAAAGANDLIYVNRGDGTTAGMTAGFDLDDTGQMLMGSGSNLTFDSSRFSASNGIGLTNTTLIAADALGAPTITNLAGNGVDITADNAFISGVTIDGATNIGLLATNANNLRVDSVTANNHAGNYGIIVRADNAALDNVAVSNSTTNANTSGMLLTAINNGSIANADITNNTSNNNVGNFGYLALATTGGDLTQVNYTGNTANNNPNAGFRILTTNAGSSSNITYANNVADTNGGNGFNSLVSDNAVMQNYNLINNVSSNNTTKGVSLTSRSAAVAQNINIQNNTLNNNGEEGALVTADTAGLITTANFTNNTSNNNTLDGLAIIADGAGSIITAANFTNNNADGNSDEGLVVYAVNDGDITTANLTSNTATNNTEDGFLANADGIGSTIGTVNYNNNISNTNTERGYFVYAVNDGDIGTANLTNNSASNNVEHGFYTYANGAGSTITTANLTGNTASNNTRVGFYSRINNAGAEITTANISGNTSNNNTEEGFVFYTQNGGVLATANIENNVADSNTEHGIYLVSADAGSSITTANVDGNTSTGNAQRGVYVYGFNDGSINAVQLQNNTVTGNTGNGIFINDDSAAGTFVADLGGGVLGSVGRNTFEDNTAEEIRVDVDGGELKAENNYWGSESGLALIELLLEDASTIDDSPSLEDDPNN